MWNDRIVVFKGVLWFLTGVATAVAVARFVLGLGVSTALTDTTPWGLWIGFDVMGGVALAAGGFVIAAVVHIFHREKYKSVARPAILTAFLGYAAVVVGLILDLGLPWNIWHPVFFWNLRSPLFEVAWCVMLYLSVLALEVAPSIFERTRFQKLYRFFTRLALPIMILGIMLSTLHQSSLGSMLLIMPFRIHPLWYSTMLPELFFVSAICLGLAVVIFESSITSWLYRRKPETETMAGLARMASFALAFYFILRLGDIWRQGKLGHILEGTWASNLFIVEMLMSAVLPMALFAIPGVRTSFKGVWSVATLAVSGFVLNRINASGLSQVWVTGEMYLPAWTEVAVTVGIVAGFALIFLFIQEHFPVDPHGLEALERQEAEMERALPRFSPFTQVWLGDGWRRGATVYSMVLVAGLALGFSAVPTAEKLVEVPSRRARGGDILAVGAREPLVYFNHARHQEVAGGQSACGTCHHLNMIGDIGTSCSDCHRQTYVATNIFDHNAHIRSLGGNVACGGCHDTGNGRTLAPSVACDQCHKEKHRMMAANTVVPAFRSAVAASYKDAMHVMCIGCHVEKAAEASLNRPDLGRCAACHAEGTVTERAYRDLFGLRAGQ
jgi:Ni/Fe-hydrogenase subunit HybB-like protein